MHAHSLNCSTQLAQLKLLQINQMLFGHGSEQYFIWEEPVFHYSITCILLQSQFIITKISKCQSPSSKQQGKNVKLTTYSAAFPKYDWFCVSSATFQLEKKKKKAIYTTEIPIKLSSHIPRQLLNFIHIIHYKEYCMFCYGKNKNFSATDIAVVLHCAFWAIAFSTMFGLHYDAVRSLATNKQLQFPEP